MSIDWFSADKAESVNTVVPPWAEQPQAEPLPTGMQPAAFTGIEVNPERRRKGTDLVVEPGQEARALCLLMGQDITDFVALALGDRITMLRAKLRNN
jgi:hypothetical protein